MKNLLNISLIAIITFFVGTTAVANASILYDIAGVTGTVTSPAASAASTASGITAVPGGSVASDSEYTTYVYGSYGTIPTGVVSDADRDTLERSGNGWTVGGQDPAQVMVKPVAVAATTNLSADTNASLPTDVAPVPVISGPSAIAALEPYEVVTYSTTTYPGNFIYPATTTEDVVATSTLAAAIASSTTATSTVIGSTNGTRTSGLVYAALQKFFPAQDYGSHSLSKKMSWSLSMLGLMLALFGAAMASGKLTIGGFALNAVRFSF